MRGNSRNISSNQSGLHEDLTETVTKHLSTQFQRPISSYSEEAFNYAVNRSNGKPWILDSGCGNGRSTATLSRFHPDAFVIGIDKSEQRLSHHNTEEGMNDKYLLLRADLIDFFQLCSRHKIKITKHYILYPNPWPKKKHLMRRFHGSPVFKDIVSICQNIEVRSNWKTYLDEFKVALNLAGISSSVMKLPNLAQEKPLTSFEEKYLQSKQQLWQLRSN